MKTRVLIVGAGLIGAQVACVQALAGHEVTVYARDPDRARRRIAAGFSLAAAAGREVRAGVEDISVVDDLGDAASGRQVILELVAEDLQLKGRLLRACAEAEPAATLATGTSSLRITAIGEAAGAAERLIGLHYLNPPLLLPLVEVIGGERTGAAHLEVGRELVCSTGMTPITVGRDVPGFAWNRLQVALLRECVHLVEEGIVAAEEVDLIITEGLARRWRHVGPLATASLGGLDVWGAISRNVTGSLSNAAELPGLEAVLSTVSDPAARARRRDAALIAEARRER